MAPYLKRIMTLIPPALLVGFVVFFSWNHFWNGDAVLYQFIFKDNTDYFLWEPIRNFSDLWTSILNHYVYVNGRFFCHIVVMAVCSFMPQWMFAIFSGIALAVLLWGVCRLCGIGPGSFRPVLSVTLLGALAFDNLTDPAFYINYIWMGAFVVLWLMMFLSHPRIKGWKLIGVALFSLLAGQAHECFALPVGLALVVYAFKARGKMSAFDWTAGTCFCLAGLTTIIAPGTFFRIGASVDMILGFPSRFDLFLLSFLPALFLWTLIRYRHRIRQFLGPSLSAERFWLWVITGNIILTVASGFQFGTRAFTIGSVGIIIIVIRLTPRHYLNLFWTAVFLFMAVWLTQIRWYYTFGQKAKYEFVSEQYGRTHADTIWMPDTLFRIELRSNANLTEHVRRRLFRDKGDTVVKPEKDFIILPESLKAVPRDFSGNICRKIGHNVYLMVQSRKHPARFISRKRFFPGVLDLRLLPDRELIFEEDVDKFDLYIASTDNWIAAYYTFDHSEGFDVDILMEENPK